MASLSSGAPAGQLRRHRLGRDARLMDPHEIYQVETTVVGCDGGGGALGHPLVYLNMEKRGAVDCPYCGRKYVLTAGAKAAAD